MDEPQRRAWLGEAAWFLAWAAASSLWCVTAARQLGATADEPSYIRIGLERWRTGSYASFMGMGTMPLAADVQTLPLYLAERCRGRPYVPDDDMAPLLPRARAMTLLFWWLLLGYGWLAGRHLAGRWGGRLAVALLACEPSLLAHAGLATTDVAITACLLALVYHFRTARDAGWLRRVGLPGLWFALALLAKASALAFMPLCLLAVELERLLRRPGNGVARFRPAALGSFGLDLLQIGVLGGVLALAYCGSDGRPCTSLTPFLEGMSDGPCRRALVWFSAQPVFSNAAEGVLWQVLHNRGGSAAYLLGRVYPQGCWYYFPAALSMKLSVGVLALLLALLLLRPRALANWACLAALALLALSVTYRIQNGVRLVLPLVGFGLVGLAAAAVWAWRDALPGWRRAALRAAPLAALGWMGWGTLAVWPDGLCYTNELWGGTANGYLCLTDSNYDWGQGLKQLDRWHRAQGRPP